MPIGAWLPGFRSIDVVESKYSALFEDLDWFFEEGIADAIWMEEIGLPAVDGEKIDVITLVVGYLEILDCIHESILKVAVAFPLVELGLHLNAMDEVFIGSIGSLAQDLIVIHWPSYLFIWRDMQ
jgi:hypothetical protein